MLKRFQELFGGMVYRAGQNSGRVDKRQRKPIWFWQVGSLRAERVLRTIQPFLVEKLGECEVALVYRKEAVGHKKKDLALKYAKQLRDLHKER